MTIVREPSDPDVPDDVYVPLSTTSYWEPTPEEIDQLVADILASYPEALAPQGILHQEGNDHGVIDHDPAFCEAPKRSNGTGWNPSKYRH